MELDYILLLFFVSKKLKLDFLAWVLCAITLPI
ncbi:Hypothetical protein SSA_1672 [Streptococcus sanguinis SK36]|uniref:Uncharacterized protein n=1 Tax=Streptococcus sanguinis (strain SK36) TaxID=388919 RepID=A3CPF3_STRSV|nr:Hypothetical protein SSA_1672 [Streptococcus sanguinis SK36]